MRTVLIFLIVLLFYPARIFAQKDSRHGRYTREVECVSENDFLFFEDYYYTAGQDLFYRRLISPGSRLFNLLAGPRKDSAKAILQYRYGMKIFNPFNIEANPPTSLVNPPFRLVRVATKCHKI